MLASPYEQFLEALLEAEVLARVASDTRMHRTRVAFATAPAIGLRLEGAQSATSSKARRGGSSGTACSWSTRSATAAGAPGCQPDLRVGPVPRRARSIVVTSDRGFEQWGDILGRRHDRRGPDRPTRPSRHTGHAQGQELPAAGTACSSDMTLPSASRTVMLMPSAIVVAPLVDPRTDDDPTQPRSPAHPRAGSTERLHTTRRDWNRHFATKTRSHCFHRMEGSSG